MFFFFLNSRLDSCVWCHTPTSARVERRLRCYQKKKKSTRSYLLSSCCGKEPYKACVDDVKLSSITCLTCSTKGHLTARWSAGGATSDCTEPLRIPSPQSSDSGAQRPYWQLLCSTIITSSSGVLGVESEPPLTDSDRRQKKIIAYLLEPI